LKFHNATGNSTDSHPDDIYEEEIFDPQNQPNYNVDYNFSYSEIGELVRRALSANNTTKPFEYPPWEDQAEKIKRLESKGNQQNN
jgi:hypothetical protein